MSERPGRGMKAQVKNTPERRAGQDPTLGAIESCLCRASNSSSMFVRTKLCSLHRFRTNININGALRVQECSELVIDVVHHALAHPAPRPLALSLGLTGNTAVLWGNMPW
jgi:hypothetical protein